MSAKALVTGAGGFLGLYIAEQLSSVRGDHVCGGFARKSVRVLCRHLAWSSVQGDIRDVWTVVRCSGRRKWM